MTEVRGYCTLCRSRCGAVYTVEEGTLTGVRPDSEDPTGAALCPKGRAAPELVRSPRRLSLRHPHDQRRPCLPFNRPHQHLHDEPSRVSYPFRSWEGVRNPGCFRGL